MAIVPGGPRWTSERADRAALPRPVVVTQQYGIGRETSDIDFLSVFAQSPEDDVESLAGIGSKLHRKYRLYMQHVGIVTPPADYESRLVRMFPSAPWKRLRLFALDATDVALSKLERNAERDREDFFASLTPDI